VKKSLHEDYINDLYTTTCSVCWATAVYKIKTYSDDILSVIKLVPLLVVLCRSIVVTIMRLTLSTCPSLPSKGIIDAPHGGFTSL
jgi:hypothetical protein